MKEHDKKGFLYRVLCGFFLGVSIVAPGVSGSVMAVMMGIYRDLIEIVSNPFKNLKKNFFYLFPMGIGALISFAVFIKLFSYLFEYYPIQSRILFMGLVAGGLPMMYREARSAKFKWQYGLGILAAFAVAAGVGILARVHGDGGGMETAQMGYLCLAGGVSGAASMVPGMSVSMVLMLFGVYDFLLKVASGATSNLGYAISIALPVGICFAVGMVLFSKLTKYVFEHFSSLAYYMVFGFMCGTLTAILPDRLPGDFAGVAGCILMFLAGIGVSGVFQYLGKSFHTEKTA